MDDDGCLKFTLFISRERSSQFRHLHESCDEPTSDIVVEIVAAIESQAEWWHIDERVAEHHEW